MAEWILLLSQNFENQLTLVLLRGKKRPQLSFVSKKILFSVGHCRFVTFPEYEVGTKCN